MEVPAHFSPESLDPRWFPALFVAMWLVSSGLVAHLCGWASLAERFRADSRPEGERFRFVSGSMGWRFLPVSYGNCLFVTVSPQGLYLSILFPFRFLSPPLFVPWSRVETVIERRILIIRYVIIRIRDHWARISLRGASGRLVKEFYEAAPRDAPYEMPAAMRFR
jgi:hypothetical protein